MISTAADVDLDWIKIAKLCREYIVCGFNNDWNRVSFVDDLPAIAPASRINITLRSGGVLLGSMGGQGESLNSQLATSLHNTMADRRFLSTIRRCDLEGLSVELWVQHEITTITSDDIRDGTNFSLGVHGAEIEKDGVQTYFKPSVSITKRRSSVSSLFGALCKKAGLDPNAWEDSAIACRRTSWSCYFASGISPPCELSSLRFSRTNTKIAAKELEGWLQDSTNYLYSHQYASGALAYIYDPVKALDDVEGLNIVRAAGCLFALSEARKSGILSSRETADRCHGNLSRYLLLSTVQGVGDGSYLVDKKTLTAPKVGATALLYLGLCDDKSESHAAESAKLLKSLLSTQNEQGRFITNFGIPEPDTRLENFYSGQTLLALVAEAERGNSEALAMCVKAFNPYRNLFTEAPTSAFVGWHVDVWAKVAILCNDQEYADFAFYQAEWLARRQINDSTRGLYFGGFSKHGGQPNFSSIVFLEALISALTLAVKLDDQRQVKRLLPNVKAGLIFCRILTANCIPDAYFKDPRRRDGGMCLGISDLRIRCDVVQHFITMSVKAHEVIELVNS